MTPTPEAFKAWKSEEARQAQVLTDAIDAAIRETGKQFDAPMINAVCGAIVTVQAQVLASIADPHHRKEMRKAMERALPRALAEAIARGGSGNCQVVVVGGPRQ